MGGQMGKFADDHGHEVQPVLRLVRRAGAHAQVAVGLAVEDGDIGHDVS